MDAACPNDTYNHARFSGQRGGFYESYFLRANHPTRPLAFWIRYTLFSPRGAPQAAIGELWGVVFDGATHHTFKAEHPWSACSFAADAFAVQVASARLGPGLAHGAIDHKGRTLAWDLRFNGAEAPLFLLPKRAYAARFPAAKALVSLPLARFQGHIEIDGARIAIDDWVGSQNHNWGARHTDHYAWGQVASFDGRPDVFLEVATARLKLGPFWTPPFTPIVLRAGGREYALNSNAQALAARGRSRYFAWTFRSAARDAAIEGEIWAEREAFTALAYKNPAGGTKTCLNTKLAACRLTLRDTATGAVEQFETKDRAAFEILTDDSAHGLAIEA